MYDADLVLLLSPLSRARPGRRARLQRILLERSLAGLSYMEGGALGFVTAGLDHEADRGATLNIRRSVPSTLDTLMDQLELGRHTDRPGLSEIIIVTKSQLEHLATCSLQCSDPFTLCMILQCPPPPCPASCCLQSWRS